MTKRPARRMVGSDIGLPEESKPSRRVIETPDGFGLFKTKAEAVDYWIARLEGERKDIREKLARAKRMRRNLNA